MNVWLIVLSYVTKKHIDNHSTKTAKVLYFQEGLPFYMFSYTKRMNRASPQTSIVVLPKYTNAFDEPRYIEECGHEPF